MEWPIIQLEVTGNLTCYENYSLKGKFVAAAFIIPKFQFIKELLLNYNYRREFTGKTK